MGQETSRRWPFQSRSLRVTSSYARNTYVAEKKPLSCFFLSPSSLPNSVKREREREREGSKRGSIETKSGKRWREREKYPGEFISRRDYQTGADTRIPSSHNSRPSRRRGCVYICIYICTLSVRGFHVARARLCVRAPATIRQGYTGGQTSARVTGGDLCLRYAVRRETGAKGGLEREAALETER